MTEYIDDEMIQLDHERHCKNRKLLKYTNARQLTWLCVALAVFGAVAIVETVESECPHCHEPIELGCSRRETWICPNLRCGYENYVGIDYCGLCGTKRGR